MNDEMVQVRDSVAWTIGRVCEHCPKALLQETYLSPLLGRLLELLAKEVRVAVNACWVGKGCVWHIGSGCGLDEYADLGCPLSVLARWSTCYFNKYFNLLCVLYSPNFLPHACWHVAMGIKWYHSNEMLHSDDMLPWQWFSHSDQTKWRYSDEM